MFQKKSLPSIRAVNAPFGERRTGPLPLAAFALGLSLLLFSSGPHAGPDGIGLQAVPEPPPLPARTQSGEALDPDVTIIRGSRHTVHEYRVHGRLYAIKIVPRNAPPYYLVDTDGDGSMDYREDLTDEFLVPQWVLFRW